MEAAHRHTVIVGGAALLAVASGLALGQGNLWSALLIASVAGLVWFGTRLQVPADAWFGAICLVGYLVGNRGFAQWQVPGVPLLPAEITLGLGALFLTGRATRERLLPVRRDALNLLVLLWLVLGAARLWHDWPRHGMNALRDAATVYYAAFFFLAQDWARDPRTLTLINRALTLGFLVAGPALVLFIFAPAAFATVTTVGGRFPLFLKTDSACALLAAGFVWLVDRGVRRRDARWQLAAALPLIALAVSNNRAGMLALATVNGWWLLTRDWARLRPVVILGCAGFLLASAIPLLSGRPWQEGLVYRLYETALSVTDFTGERVYAEGSLGDKGDNNDFRLQWWLTTLDEAWSRAPVTGLGFGHDLADRFLRSYYAVIDDEFSARSPHNFLVTVFARLGLLGLFVIAVLIALLVRRAWRDGRAAAVAAARATYLPGDFVAPAAPYWLGALGILTSACFGVVLEGPMGAVLFWTLLGLGSGVAAQTQETSPAPLPPWHQAIEARNSSPPHARQVSHPSRPPQRL